VFGHGGIRAVPVSSGLGWLPTVRRTPDLTNAVVTAAGEGQEQMVIPSPTIVIRAAATARSSATRNVRIVDDPGTAFIVA